MNETPKRLNEWLKAAIIHQIKKQEKLLKKIKPDKYPLIPILFKMNNGKLELL